MLVEYGELNQTTLVSFCGLNLKKHKSILDDLESNGMISKEEKALGKRIVTIYKPTQKGNFSHPWLGISGASLTPDLAKDVGLQKNFRGVLVNSVVKGGPAEKAGLKGSTIDENSKMYAGDIITAIDGHAVKRIEDIIFYIEEHKSVGDKVVLTVNRGNEVIELDTILQTRPTSNS